MNLDIKPNSKCRRENTLIFCPFGRFKYHNPGLHFLSGFNAYVGYLLLEHTHANPVLVTFCQLLIKTINDRQASEEAASKDHVQSNPCSSTFMFFNRFFDSPQ